jgi:hypothetical protein
MKSLLLLLVPFLSALGSTLDVQAQYDADIKTAHDEGVASVVIDPAKVFTQSDVDAAFAKGVASVPSVPSVGVDPSKQFAQSDIDAAIAAFKLQALAAMKSEEGALEKILA